MANHLNLTPWGPRVSLEGLPDLYAPTKIEKFTATRGGIDNLSLSSTDTFLIPGKGEFTVDFKGYFRVARANPSTSNWSTAEWSVNMVDLRLEGNSPQLGRLTVRLNGGAVSAGQVFAAGGVNRPAACRIATGAVFGLSDLKMAVFNKEPILLMNDGIESVPPVEDPDGEAHIYRLPLYDTSNPDGAPVAYLIRLKYTVGNYVTKAEAEAFRKES